MIYAAATRATNRRALIAFIAVLAAAVMVAAVAMLILQRQQLRVEAQEELQTEIGLLGELTTDSLLRSDYAAVEGLVQRWVERHDYVMRITATMPNGFVLVDASKASQPKTPLTVTRKVVFNGRTLITLYAISDLALAESSFSAIVVRISIMLLSIILILGWALWWVLQRTAIHPLEAQIRAREEKEHELLHRTAELEAALEELESFSYSVSHDLRGPLRAIDGFSHALTEDYGKALDATALDYIYRTRAAAQRMGVLIDDLLTLSRMTRRDVAIENVDLSAMAHEALARISESEPGRAVELVVAENVRTQGDPGLLAIVLDNLLQNAWKYTARTSNPRIEFGARQQGGGTVYFVKDNGAGFDMQYCNKLFRPFQRLHAPQEFSGSGIGLATVARIIQRHGGRIWAEGETGKGATFSFTLAPGATLEAKRPEA